MEALGEFSTNRAAGPTFRLGQDRITGATSFATSTHLLSSLLISSLHQLSVNEPFTGSYNTTIAHMKMQASDHHSIG